MRIQTRFRQRRVSPRWTRVQHEALLRITETAELMASYQQDMRDFPPWQQSAELRWCLSVRAAELARRGIDVGRMRAGRGEG